MQLLLESLFNGVAIGSVLMMAALGLAIVFGLMGVINLAHGELMMLGAYTTYVGANGLQTSRFSIYLWPLCISGNPFGIRCQWSRWDPS